MIDLHSHILPGIDDGASDMATAVAMARKASVAGVRKILATPHVDHKYDPRAGTIRSAVAALNDQLARERVPVEVLPGAEVAAHRIPELGARELAELGLGGGPYLLVEAPLSSTAGDFEIFLSERPASDRRYVLAHPERSPTLQRDPERLQRLVLAGAVLSITASSLSGRFGGSVRRFAISLFEQGMVHNVASDMHNVRSRPPGISEHLRAAAATLPGLIELERWLTQEVPAAVIAGRSVELPPRLERVRRTGFGLGRIVRGTRTRC
ncbi:MAG TPA: CpsB/CapC family capsule biosynthesis tyrosine phosphatase [Solirubrobacteraceae bacterium]|nr:CpsB/CapC family capsule biosynthesis tyrosine phosphatase [Solirubrobacteraceae bacterium]